MKRSLKIAFLSLIILNCFGNSAHGQKLLVNDSLGFRILLPDLWHYDTLFANPTTFTSFSEDSTVTLRIFRAAAEPGKNSLDYLLHLEILLADMGFTPNYVEDENRFTILEESNSFHAEDVAHGVYLFEKENVYYAKMISVFHKGDLVYVTLIILPVDQSAGYAAQLETIHSSFQIIR